MSEEIKNPVITMLLGETSILPHGSFGEVEDNELRRSPPRRYWWRRYLRPEIENYESTIKQLEADKEKLEKKVAKQLRTIANFSLSKYVGIEDTVADLKAKCKELEDKLFSNRTTINDANTTITGEVEIIVKKD